MKEYIDKSAVVAEIESKIKYAQHLGDNAINSSMQQFYDGMKQGCVDILSFIDTLQEEPVSEELEEVALLYYPIMSRISEPHGVIPADTQSHYLGDANQDKREGFIDGAKWQKQQMMKNAVEREVKVDAGGYPYIDATELYDYENDKPLAKAGDKVKVLIVKDK